MSPAIQPFLAWGGYGPSPGRVTVSRFQTARPRSLITPPPLAGSEPTRHRSIRTPTSRKLTPSQPQRLQPLHQPQEHAPPRVPRQQPVHDPTARAHNLSSSKIPVMVGYIASS